MAARLTRGKRKIVTAGIPYTVPDAADLPARLDGVAQTAYLAFTAGYAPGSGPDLLRTGLAGEAVRLVRVTLAQCPARAGAAGPPRALAAPALPPRRAGRRCRPARPASRPGPLTVAPRRGRRRALAPHPDDAASQLRARRELPAPGPGGGRARHGHNGIRPPGGTSSARATTSSSRSTRRRRCGSRRRWRWPSGTARAPGWPPSPTSTRRCRSATACRRCGVSCSPAPATTPQPSRPSTSRSPAARNDVEREHLTRRRDELRAGRA